jgi:filamentous hemagglutinin family protein
MAIYQEQNWRLVRLFKAMGAITLTVGCLSASDNRAFAQNITLDGTLGPAGTLTGPIYTIPQGVGQTIGSNLFHSFGQFNLDTGEVSLFQSGADIRNILSRVTGGSPSIINGRIFTQSSNVNLFLINPTGIQFGPNALLNVGSATRGSFVATTVDALVWPNGAQFSATNPSGANSLLTIVGDPGGFLSTLQRPAPIVSSSNLLDVYGGQSLLLLGGNVRLEGGVLLAPGGRVELGGLSAPGTVGLFVEGNTLSLGFPDGVARADVSLTNRARVDAAAGGGGSIAINAQTVELLGGSVVFTGILPGRGSVDSQAGDIEINATGAITVSELSLIANQVFGIGDGGDMKISTLSLAVTDGAQLLATTFGRGDAGNVRITATDTVAFTGVGSNRRSSGARSTVAQEAKGNGGDIEITSHSLLVSDGAFLSADTFGRGDAGNVRITATDTVAFTGVGSNRRSSGARSTVAQEAKGNGGDIEITSHSLSVSDGAQLVASTFGQGDAGNVKITATDSVSFTGAGSNGFSSGAFSSVEQKTAEGRGGNVEISANSLLVSDGAVLSASTFGRGDAGNVKIAATDSVSFTEVGSNGGSSGASSTVEQGAEGKGGDVEITSNSLSVSDGAQLVSSTLGQGDAGSVRITATDTVSFTGVGSNGGSSGARSSVAQGAEGKGGDIEITSNSLSVSDGAQLIAGTVGQGDAGNVRITATDTVSFAGVSSNGRSSGAFSSVDQKEAEGKGGDIEINSNSLSVSDGAVLVASTFGQGDAGNVRITATDTVSLAGVGSNGQSSAVGSTVEQGGEGKGGDIEITTGSLSLTDAFISSQSEGNGIAGDILIETRQNLELDRSNISATTLSGDGGNIRLRVRDLLLLRNDSNISTTAGQAGAGGDGGNITINADFVVAVPKEDSDITANAFNGRGGNINITTQGIYGLTFRKEDIPASSDITASSQFGVDGEFQLDLLTDVDPSQGLGELPANLVDATGLIDRRCTPSDNTRRSRFIITGRGGLPPSPNDVLQNEEVIVNWITLNSQEDSTNPVPPEANPTNTAPKQLVEAQSWVYGSNGEVILTAEAPTATPHRSWQTSPSCKELLQ